MADDEEWQSLARDGRLIWAAKVLAAQTSMGLEAADYVESWFAKNCLPPNEAAHRLCCLSLRRQIRNYAASQKAEVTFTMAWRSEEVEKADLRAEPDLSVWLNAEKVRPPDLAVHIVYPSDSHSYVLAPCSPLFPNRRPDGLASHSGNAVLWTSFAPIFTLAFWMKRT